METVVVTVSHSLGKDEVMRRLKPALSRASLSFPILKLEHEVWTDNRLDFQVRAIGQVVAGNVQVFDDTVRLEVSLPWLLAKFANAVERTIKSRGQLLLEKK